MSDREALAAALANPYPTTEDWSHILAAARERLAQLPEKCETCRGGGYDQNDCEAPCPTCHGYCQVYPAELVERINAVLQPIGRGTELAVAVLAALDSQSSGETL